MTIEEKNDLYNRITEIELIFDNCPFVEENIISVENAILYLRQSNLYNKICSLNFCLNKYGLYIVKLYCESLKSYLRLLIAVNRAGKEIERWVSFLSAFETFRNLTRKEILNYYINLDNSCGGTGDTEYLLACSTMVDDSRHTEREVLRILDFSGHKYVVIPVLKCKTTLFEKILYRYNVKAIHIASHGKPNKIEFLDSDLGHRGFKNIFMRTNTSLDLLFLNACESETLRKDLCTLCNLITYDGILYLPTPYNFAESFYLYFLVQNNSLNNSFVYSKSAIPSSKMYKI